MPWYVMYALCYNLVRWLTAVKNIVIIKGEYVNHGKKQIIGRHDVFHSFLVENAEYDGYFEFPKLKTSDKLPEKVVTLSKAMSKTCHDFDSWIVFYEHDVKFERFWNNPKQYLDKLKKFKGVISPDFSLYRNMPLCMQIWNTYRSRALAAWLQNNGIEVSRKHIIRTTILKGGFTLSLC